jgi:hypothetical protein
VGSNPTLSAILLNELRKNLRQENPYQDYVQLAILSPHIGIMPWQNISTSEADRITSPTDGKRVELAKPQVFFSLRYELGFKYLDKCGELMIILQEEFGYIPGEIKPTGAKLEHPDYNIYADIDTTELTIRQEHPSDGGKELLEASVVLSNLVLNMFDPAVPIYTGFAAHSYLAYETEDQLRRATLACDAEAHFSLAEVLSVQPQSQQVHHEFLIGSYELEVSMKEVSLNSPPKRMASAGFRSTERQSGRKRR